MKKFIPNTLRTLFLSCLFSLLGACSVVDSYRVPTQPNVVPLPKIPEIKRQQTKPRVVPSKKVVVKKTTRPNAQVFSSTYQIKNKPVLPKKVIQPQITAQQKQDKKLLESKEKQKAVVDIDPYANIPDSSTNKSISTAPNPVSSKPTSAASSPAVKTLMNSARADIAIGRSRSAISKLERGLRIEPQNGQLWHMLAKAHYSNSAYLHSISIAKKSNSNTDDDVLIKQNWQLIKKAGERSGNASAIKEALDYMKLNP